MSKLFLYDQDSASTDTLTVMRKKKYVCTALTNDPDFFWQSILALEPSSIFVLLSHGDKNGPLAVKGTVGDDIDLTRFSDIIKKNKLALYLLSCHTGLDPCGSTLTKNGLNFVAPKGAADFQTIGSEQISVFSKDGTTFPGWTGPLSPNRSNKALSLP
ncbi:hypothetical protein [Serratia plymuthica]|uniref:hypothetical protein n=1 Tax=Serratia plymuthica TaxID=82996 RepID=UPI001114866E|nr:hypothetical protein [Serratia plymuthica]